MSRSLLPARAPALRLAVRLSCVLPLVWAAGPVSATNSADGPGFVPGRILVMPRAGLPDAALDRILKDNGNGRARRVGRSELRIVDLPPGREKQVVSWLARHPHIEFAEIDRRVPPAAAPNDPYFGSAWHLSKINAANAWDRSAGSNVTVAILDTGVDANHPDLSGRMVPGWNFYDNNSNTADVHGHGTAVAGAAAATLNNGVGVAAVAGQARIMPVRISDPNAYASWSTVAQALTWAADKGARVANISFVGVAGSASVQSAASYMKSKGGLVIVAAGNNNRDEGLAATSAMIPVSATDANDQKTSFSSWGKFVAMSAPGINVWTTQRGGSYGQWWGTSIASPVTAGVVALMMSANPKLSASEVERLLFDSAVDLGAAGRDAVFGYGRVDAAAAVAAAAAANSTADTQAPTVAIASPGADQTVSGVVGVDVAAADDVGVAKVELRVDGAVVGTDSAAPFAFSWDAARVSNGVHALTAVAYDGAGHATTSAAVAVNVANPIVVDTLPPAVSFGSPADGATVSGVVAIRLSASDDSASTGLVTTLHINGSLAATTTGGSLTYNWNTRKAAPGVYTLLATARDAAGNVGTRSISVRR